MKRICARNGRGPLGPRTESGRGRLGPNRVGALRNYRRDRDATHGLSVKKMAVICVKMDEKEMELSVNVNKSEMRLEFYEENEMN